MQLLFEAIELELRINKSSRCNNFAVNYLSCFITIPCSMFVYCWLILNILLTKVVSFCKCEMVYQLIQGLIYLL